MEEEEHEDEHEEKREAKDEEEEEADFLVEKKKRRGETGVGWGLGGEGAEQGRKGGGEERMERKRY